MNLQYGDYHNEISQVYKSTGITIYDWSDADPLKDLDNFAAQIAALDLVITIDNSTAHFAGALGIPTWVLLPFAPDWRWLLDRDDSPWYPTVRLFRQKEIGDWEAVFNEVHQALIEESMTFQKAVYLSDVLASTIKAFRGENITEGNQRLVELLSLLNSETVELPEDKVLKLKSLLNESLNHLKNRDYSSLADILENNITHLLGLSEASISND